MDFDGPLPKHTKLDYSECYAKILLEKLFPGIYFDLLIEDKPDLQSKSQSLGIEITKAYDNNELDELWYAYNNGQAKNRQKVLKRIEALGGKVDNDILRSVGSVDSFTLILKAINKKIEKLNSGNYKKLESTELFVFSYIYANTNMCLDALKSIQEITSKHSKKFNKIFVSVPEHLYVFHLEENNYQDIPIDRDLQYNFACDARKMVENNM